MHLEKVHLSYTFYQFVTSLRLTILFEPKEHLNLAHLFLTRVVWDCDLKHYEKPCFSFSFHLPPSLFLSISAHWLALPSLLISLCPKYSVFTQALSQYPLDCWRYALGLNGCPELSSSQVLRHLSSFFTHLFIPESLSMGLLFSNKTWIFSVLWKESEQTQIRRLLSKNQTQICYLKVQCVISAFLVTPSTLAKNQTGFLNTIK